MKISHYLRCVDTLSHERFRSRISKLKFQIDLFWITGFMLLEIIFYNIQVSYLTDWCWIKNYLWEDKDNGLVRIQNCKSDWFFPFLFQLKYKRRVYKMLQMDEKQLKSINSKANHKKFLENIGSNNVDKINKMCVKGLDPNFHCESTGGKYMFHNFLKKLLS